MLAGAAARDDLNSIERGGAESDGQPDLLTRLAERWLVSRRTLLLGFTLPIVCIAVVAASIYVAPADEARTIVFAALIGIAAGLATTSAGVYGGVMVPGLLLLGIDPRFAAAVTLFLQPIVIPLAAGSHYRMGNFSRRVARPLLIGGVIGGFVGPLFAALLSKELIARLVAVMIIVVGVVVLAAQRLRGLGPTLTEEQVPRGRVAGIGLTAGFSSGISGAGWGPLGVTMLILSRIDPKQAIGSSLFARAFMAAAAVVGYVIAQTAFQNVLPNWWIVLPLLTGSLAPMVFGAVLVSRLSRERATVAITLLSISLAVPTLVWGH